MKILISVFLSAGVIFAAAKAPAGECRPTFGQFIQRDTKPRWPFLFTVNLGVGSLNYDQTGVGPVRETAVSARLLVIKQFAERWDWTNSVGGTLLALGTSNPGVSARVLRIDTHVGYEIPIKPGVFKVTVRGGFADRNLYGEGAIFGYRNEIEFQVFPVFLWSVHPKHSLLFYVKYAPLLNNGGFNPADSEVSTGLTWLWFQIPKHPLSLALDYYSFSTISNGVTYANSGLTFSVGFGF